jgi:hypothetical protein
MQMIMGRARMLRRLAQNLGPYLMLEILLPGGTLLVMMLFLYHRKDNLRPVAKWVLLAVTRALDGWGAAALHSPPQLTTIRSDR